MLKNIWTTVFLFTVVIYQKPANALDLRVQPRFKTGIQYYEFEQPAFSSDQDPDNKFQNMQSSIEFSDWLPFVSGGTTLFIDRFFVDVDVQYLFDGRDAPKGAIQPVFGRKRRRGVPKAEKICPHQPPPTARIVGPPGPLVTHFSGRIPTGRPFDSAVRSDAFDSAATPRASRACHYVPCPSRPGLTCKKKWG